MNEYKEGSLTSKLTWLILGFCVLFADIMYVETVWRVIENPILKLLAIGGGIALGASVLMIPIKLRNGDIADGNQRTVAMIVLVVDFILLTLNTIVGFAEPGQSDDLLTLYAQYIAPATPVFVAAGILAIMMFNPIDILARKANQAEKENLFAILELKATLQRATLDQAKRAVQSPRYKEYIAQQVDAQSAEILRQTFGGQGPAVMVESQAQAMPRMYLPAIEAQTASNQQFTQDSKQESIDDILARYDRAMAQYLEDVKNTEQEYTQNNVASEKSAFDEYSDIIYNAERGSIDDYGSRLDDDLNIIDEQSSIAGNERTGEWTLDRLLAMTGKSRTQLKNLAEGYKLSSPKKAWDMVVRFFDVPQDLDYDTFAPLWAELMEPGPKT